MIIAVLVKGFGAAAGSSVAKADSGALDLILYRLEGSQWRPVTVAPDGTAIIMADGTYAVASSAPSMEFGFRDIYAFPNPARHGANPTLHVEAGMPDSGSIAI